MSKKTAGTKQLILALKNIPERAMSSFAFDEDLFDRRDIEGLAKIGGESCDWTMIAISADDALRGKSQ